MSSPPNAPPELVHAQTAEIMLKTALQLSSFTELFLETGDPSIVKISLELIKTVKWDSVSDRVKLLQALLSPNRITVEEFPIFCHISFCLLIFNNGQSESHKAKIKGLQVSNYQKLANETTNPIRFQELTLLSQHFVNIFLTNL